MKVSPRCLVLILAALTALAASGCKPKPSERPATVTTDAKEKHTKTKAHKREKKEQKKKSGGDKKTAKPTPEKPA